MTLRHFSITASQHLLCPWVLSPASTHTHTHTPADTSDQWAKRFQCPWVFSQPDEVTCTVTHWHKHAHMWNPPDAIPKERSCILCTDSRWQRWQRLSGFPQNLTNVLSTPSPFSSSCFFDPFPWSIVVTTRNEEEVRRKQAGVIKSLDVDSHLDRSLSSVSWSAQVLKEEEGREAHTCWTHDTQTYNKVCAGEDSLNSALGQSSSGGKSWLCVLS